MQPLIKDIDITEERERERENISHHRHLHSHYFTEEPPRKSKEQNYRSPQKKKELLGTMLQ